MWTQNVTAPVAFSLTRFLYINWLFVFMWYYNLNSRRVHLFIKGYQGTLTYKGTEHLSIDGHYFCLYKEYLFFLNTKQKYIVQREKATKKSKNHFILNFSVNYFQGKVNPRKSISVKIYIPPIFFNS